MTVNQTTPVVGGLNLKLLGTNDNPREVISIAGAELYYPFLASGIAANDVWAWIIHDDIEVKTLFLNTAATANGSNTLRIVIRLPAGVNLWDFTLATNALIKLGNLYYLVFPDAVYLRDGYQLYVSPNFAIDVLQFNAAPASIQPDIIGNKVTAIPA